MNKPAHILVIRLSAMGDVAMVVPVLKAITEIYPEVKLTVLTRTFFAPLFTEIQNVGIFEPDLYGRHKGITGLRLLASELQEKDIDAVADLHNVLRTKILKFIFRWNNIPVAQIDKGRQEKKELTRSKNKILRPLKTTHDRYADVFAHLGLPVDLSLPSPQPPKKLSLIAEELIGQKHQTWIGVAPFAQHQGKVYPFDLMQQVLDRLSENDEFRIFLFGGGSSETKMLSKWEETIPNAFNTTEKLSFQDQVALISQLDLMISMDSGNAHIATIFGIPIISIWGVTHPFIGFTPYSQPAKNSLLPDLEKYPLIPTSVYGDKIPKGYENVMRSIPPERIVNRVKEILSQ